MNGLPGLNHRCKLTTFEKLATLADYGFKVFYGRGDLGCSLKDKIVTNLSACRQAF
jgi:hypothetical protein